MSSVALLATVTVLSCLRSKLNSPRTPVQIALALTLMLVNIIYLLGFYGNRKAALCKSIGFLFMFLMLSTGAVRRSTFSKKKYFFVNF